MRPFWPSPRAAERHQKFAVVDPVKMRRRARQVLAISLAVLFALRIAVVAEV
jgi:hypothetical protein